MRIKSSRRLAGCLAIEILIAAGLWAAAPEYRAASASYGRVRALAIEDAHGARAVVAEAAFGVTLGVSDLAAAQLLRDYALDRSGILLRGAGPAGGRAAAAAAAQELITAVAAALGKLEPARLAFSAGSLAVMTADGRCLAAIRADATLGLAADACAQGQPVHSPIRSAFRTVDLKQVLSSRDAVSRVYPVQAIAFGREFAILALGGDAPAAEYGGKGLLVAPYAGDDAPYADVPAVRNAIREVLARVGR